MANNNSVRFLNDKINSVGRDLIILNERHRREEQLLIDEKSELLSLLEKVKKLNKMTGLDDNGNFLCLTCGSVAEEKLHFEGFISRRYFGCHKCDVFYRDEDMWNEKNTPD